MSNNPSDLAHWRDSARAPRFFIIDANIIWPMFIFLFAMSMRTTILLIVSALFLLALERTNFTIIKFIRYVYVFIGGQMRYRQGWWQ